MVLSTGEDEMGIASRNPNMEISLIRIPHQFQSESLLNPTSTADLSCVSSWWNIASPINSQEQLTSLLLLGQTRPSGVPHLRPGTLQHPPQFTEILHSLTQPLGDFHTFNPR